MTFHARLTELLEKATKGPFITGSMEAPDGHAMSWHGNWYVDSEAPRVNGERYGDPKADALLHKLLLDHAEAIRDLVVSTDLMLAAWDSENYKAFVIHKKMVKESLAKLKEPS